MRVINFLQFPLYGSNIFDYQNSKPQTSYSGPYAGMFVGGCDGVTKAQTF